MRTLELAKIGRLFHKAAVDDAGQPNADRVHGLSRCRRLNFLRKTLRDSVRRQAEKRFVLRALLVDTQLADQLMPVYQPSGDVIGGGDPNCPSHVSRPTTSPVC